MHQIAERKINQQQFRRKQMHQPQHLEGTCMRQTPGLHHHEYQNRPDVVIC
jgi:hypothetical protein